MTQIIGIDLGTTFSAVAAVQDGQPQILADGQQRIIPSVVGFTPEGKLVTGTSARNQYALYPERTARSVKRLMGTDEKIHLNDRDYSPAEISALILRQLKGIAEAQMGEEVTRAVITVPAFFSDAARQATREAGELAGFTVERIINEPTAAALAYGLRGGEENQLIAVYDLGGGTFDVSIVEMSGGVLEVRASHGDTRLGGDDFDELLRDFIADAFLEEHGVDPRGDASAWARLLHTAEAAKITLSSQPLVQVREEFLMQKDGKPLHLDMRIDRPDFEDLIESLVEKTLTAFDQALVDANLKVQDLGRVIFVGGSTRIPLVWNKIAAHTGKEPMVEINPDEAVALGAAAQAAIIEGQPLDAILVDVTPHSLGVKTMTSHFGRMIEDHFGVIIPRNTTLPTTRAEAFQAIHPDQENVRVEVYQGESPVASQNTLLGEFLFENLKTETRGEPPVFTVEFDLDLNGILHVNAVDLGSGKTRQTTLNAAHSKIDPASKEAMTQHLASLTSVEVEDEDPLAARARHVMEAQMTETEELAETLHNWEDAKEAGNNEAAEELHQQLLDVLYDLEEDEDGK